MAFNGKEFGKDIVEIINSHLDKKFAGVFLSLAEKEKTLAEVERKLDALERKLEGLPKKRAPKASAPVEPIDLPRLPRH